MKNETKKKVKNTLFKIALLPYIIMIIMCIYYYITGYSYKFGYNPEKTVYGYTAIEEYLGYVFNYWFDILLDFPINLIAISIIIMWIGYQIYYFITLNDNRVSPIIKDSVFYLCIAVVIIGGVYIWVPIILVFMFSNLFILLFYPALLICLLYIIIYIIVNKRKKKKETIYDIPEEEKNKNNYCS